MISLYRKGDTHCIKGVTCEMKLFPVKSLAQAKADGWLTSIDDVNKPTKKATPAKKAPVKRKAKAVKNDD